MTVRDPRLEDPPLVRRRLALRLSQRAVAAKAGLTQNRIWQIEAGLRPRREELLRLALALSCSPDELAEPEVRRAAR